MSQKQLETIANNEGHLNRVKWGINSIILSASFGGISFLMDILKQRPEPFITKELFNYASMGGKALTYGFVAMALWNLGSAVRDSTRGYNLDR